MTWYIAHQPDDRKRGAHFTLTPNSKRHPKWPLIQDCLIEIA